MSLFLSLLPLFIFGNIHCAGMCGPLVMLLSRHPYRWAYFLGRLFSFSLAGGVAAEIGMGLFSFLSHYHISAAFSFLFGGWIVLMGLSLFFKFRWIRSPQLIQKIAALTGKIALLMTYYSFYSLFLFGALTLLLPCGQILIVFSIIALQGTPLTGLVNGFLFALLTSPSLIAIMHTSSVFSGQKKRYHLWMGGSTVAIGFLALLRGCADCGWINHFVLNLYSSPALHLVLY
jgi:sulfite exporter TauE/SafE